jgi:pyruvate carboxylase
VPPLPFPLFHLQYTNLKFQAMSLGLGEEWDRICRAYAAANRALGDIVKVGR